MIGNEPVARHRQGVASQLPLALFAPSATAPATTEKNEPVAPAPTLYWFNEWPDVVDTDRLTVRGVTYEVHTTPADWRGNAVGGLVVQLRVDQLAGLAIGRADAESRFTETLEAFTSGRTLGDDGLYEESETILYADVEGGVRFPSLTVSEREQGAQVPAVQGVEIHVAVGATPDVVVNVEWRVTASLVDPSLVGRTFRTKGQPQAGFVTEHRYPVEAVS